MGRHPVNQRFDRVHSNGAFDLQSGGLAVSARLATDGHPKAYESCIDLLGGLR